jgi:hypothetical protein
MGWLTNGASQRETRRVFSVVAFSQLGEEVARWNFQDGWPSKVVANYDGATGMLVEILEIVHEGMERIA